MNLFLEQLAKDVDTIFLNEEEFGEWHIVNDQRMLVTIDTSRLDDIKVSAQYAQEIYRAEMILSVRSHDLGYRPAHGSAVTVDGSVYRVTQVSGEQMYRLILEANE